ncbi:MAG: TIGR04211 family SH3 domain-containing protein [Gammaproteobacteria bacterium]|nr:TIGR04211 family SH3 domain-containing protein [Gammaproteobacteria bacterium]
MRNTVCGAIGILVLLAFAPVTALGDTAYVTDNLRLGLYEAEDTSGRPLKMMDSGQAMEILTRDRNYANVRLPDGTEGWVKAAYLVDEKPAKLIVAEITAERDALLAELETIKRAFAEPAAAIQTLKDEAATRDAQLAAANERIGELEASVASVQGVREQYRGSLPLSWVAIAIAVCLIGGIVLGMWWVDRRSRLRHGGIRIY